jgi:hypothetical protein
LDLREYYRLGATDIFTNVPERYCEQEFLKMLWKSVL